MRLLGAVLIVTVLTLPVLGQGNTKIDDIRSFRGFTFGSPPDQYGGDLQIDLIISYGLKYYKYMGKEPSRIFDHKIVDANLGFRNDKLEYIDFFFSKLVEEDFNQLVSQLSNDFGEAKILERTDEQGVVQAVEWKGVKTWVQLYRYDNTANDDQDRRKTVLMLNDIQQ